LNGRQNQLKGKFMNIIIVNRKSREINGFFYHIISFYISEKIWIRLRFVDLPYSSKEFWGIFYLT